MCAVFIVTERLYTGVGGGKEEREKEKRDLGFAIEMKLLWLLLAVERV